MTPERREIYKDALSYSIYEIGNYEYDCPSFVYCKRKTAEKSGKEGKRRVVLTKTRTDRSNLLVLPDGLSMIFARRGRRRGGSTVRATGVGSFRFFRSFGLLHSL